MRFVLVSLSPSGGLFQFSYQLGAHLAENGHEVELVTGPKPEISSRVPGFAVNDSLPTWHPGATAVESLLVRRTRRVARGARHVAALAKLVAHVQRRRPDVILWHEMRFAIDCWCLVIARRLLPDTVMATVMHEARPLAEQRRSGSLYRSSPVLIRSISMAVNRLDLIFVLGEKTRAELREHWDPPGDVVVIPHGDEGVFLADVDVVPVGSTGQHTLFFGTWIRHKGIDILLDSFEMVRAELPEATLTLAGAVAGDVDFDAIRRRASKIGGVTLHPGYVAMPAVPALMSEARVVAAPYLRANQSGVVHLAQTFGRPVVATAVGDIPSAVTHDVSGLLIEPGDCAALTTALLRLLRDPDLAARLGTEGQRRVQSEGSWTEIATKVHDAAQRLASEKKAS